MVKYWDAIPEDLQDWVSMIGWIDTFQPYLFRTSY